MMIVDSGKNLSTKTGGFFAPLSASTCYNKIVRNKSGLFRNALGGNACADSSRISETDRSFCVSGRKATMLIANGPLGEKCIAWETEKVDGPFFCPECESTVILRKGRIKAHHYAHTPPLNCTYGAGESELHLRAKRAIYESLKKYPGCSKCELERRLNGVRPDVSLYVGKVPIAIELQRSDLSADDIAERMRRYQSLGIAVIWIIPSPAPQDQAVCRPAAWQRFIHTMYWGRLYHWFYGAYVTPIHLLPHKYWVEEREWHDGYDVQIAGGYSKTSKVKRTVAKTFSMHLADDFGAKARPPFKTREGDIPQCRLWADTFPRWWE